MPKVKTTASGRITESRITAVMALHGCFPTVAVGTRSNVL